tara:strand:+ start:2958 stop:3287 length:330 start_codon:yes stop_codon:yes gene_type:complete
VTTEPEILIFSTASTCVEAESLGKLLVDNRLVACVNIIPRLTSIFLWEGSTVTEDETLLLMKSTLERFDDVEKLIKEHHSYSIPEIIAIPILKGSREYLSWIHKVTNEM